MIFLSEFSEFDWIFFLLIIGFTLSFIFFIFIYNNKITKVYNFYNTQALKRKGIASKGFLLSYPKLYFSYKDKDISVFTILGGRYSPPISKLTVNSFSISNKNLIVYKEGFLSKFGKSLGVQDIEIGIDSFDSKFIIKGSDELFIRNILSFDIQDKMLRIIHKLNAEVYFDGNSILISFPYYVKKDSDLDDLINLSISLSDKIDDY